MDNLTPSDQMSNELTVFSGQQGVSLVDIRMDSKTFPRLKNLSMQIATARLQQVVMMAYTYTGRPVDEGRLSMVAKALYNELMEDKRGIGTANITIEEIGHAVKSEILEADGDIYINIAFLYRAVCKYALGEGHEAQESANSRRRAQREAQLKASSVGAMLQVYAGKTLNNTTK